MILPKEYNIPSMVHVVSYNDYLPLQSNVDSKLMQYKFFG